MATAAVPIVNRKKIAPGKILINEKWRDARDGATMNTIDPTTEKVITSVAKASPADADEAVAAAAAAFEEGPWPKMHLEQRAKLLFRIADILDDRPNTSLSVKPWIWACLTGFSCAHHAAFLRTVSLFRWSLHVGDEWGLSVIL